MNAMNSLPTCKCEICGAGYMKKGNLEKHMEDKHHGPTKIRSGGECSVCGSCLSDARSFEKHMKSHKTCSVKVDGVKCGKTFGTAEETMAHKKKHTTFDIFKIESSQVKGYMLNFDNCYQSMFTS